MNIFPVLTKILKVIDIVSSEYYIITYSTQNKAVLDVPLIKSVVTKDDPITFLINIRKSQPQIEISILYTQSITQDEYKKLGGSNA